MLLCARCQQPIPTPLVLQYAAVVVDGLSGVGPGSSVGLTNGLVGLKMEHPDSDEIALAEHIEPQTSVEDIEHHEEAGEMDTEHSWSVISEPCWDRTAVTRWRETSRNPGIRGSISQ
jgi:hypothetical protein